MSCESIFLDESGDIGSNSRYYLVTLVFHNQNQSIKTELDKLNQQLNLIDFPAERAIHSGPLIRRENEYRNLEIPIRKRIFNRLYAFTRKAGVVYKTFIYKKAEFPGKMNLEARFARDLSLFIDNNIDFFTSFDKVIVYYDNGQSIVTQTINAVFAAKFFDVEFRLVMPHEYRLFQSADLLCTLELLRAKEASNELTSSELKFFGSASKLKKDFLKQLGKLRFSESP